MKGPFHSVTQFGSWFLKKGSQGSRFFTVVHACTKSLNEPYKKFFQPLNYLYVDQQFLLIWTRIDLKKDAGVSKHPCGKIMQVLWIVVSYFLKNVKHRIEHDIDSIYGDIRHFWNLQQIWWIPCYWGRWWILQSVSL